jgi:hypothetical protein
MQLILQILKTIQVEYFVYKMFTLQENIGQYLKELARQTKVPFVKFQREK